MEGVTPFAEAQISATHVIANILHEVSRHRKGQFKTPIYSSETTGHGVPLDPVRTLIIADTSQLTVRATDRLENRNGLALLLGFLNLFGVGLLLLHLPGQCALDGLGGLDTGGTHQLSRKVRRLCSQRIVRAFVQLHTIATGRGKALVGNGIEASRMLLKGCLECACLLRRGVQLHGNRSVHAKSISYSATFVKWHRDTSVPQPQERKRT